MPTNKDSSPQINEDLLGLLPRMDSSFTSKKTNTPSDEKYSKDK